MLIHTTTANTNINDLYGIGETTEGQLGLKNSTKYDFTAIKSLNSFGFSSFIQNISLVAGGDKFHSFVFRDNGIIVQDFVYTWGVNGMYELGRGGKYADTCENILPYQSGPGRIDISFVFTGNDAIRMIDSGYQHTHIVTNSNKIFNWGSNFDAQLGRTDGIQSATNYGLIPLEVTSLIQPSIGSDTVHSVYGGKSHSILLTNQGNVYAYGDNTYSQLGIADTVGTPRRSTPIQIAGLTNVVLVAVGEFFSVALKTDGTDGTIWGWGSDSHGQITGASTFDLTRIQVTPAQIGTRTDVVHISAGRNHLVALHKNGSLIVYGDNTYLQRSTPIVNSNLTYVFAIRNNTFYVDVAGTLWGYGQGANQSSYLLGPTQNTISIPIYITSLPSINVNVSFVYEAYLAKNFIFNTFLNTLGAGQNAVCLKFDEDTILSSGEYLRDTNAIRTLNCIANQTNSTCSISGCNVRIPAKFKSFKEKLLFERGLFIKNMCCLADNS